MSKLHGPVFGTARTVAEVMENARRRVDASVANAKDQRIRDLEREAVGFQEELEKAHRYIDKLEREVERLQSLVDGWTSAEAFNGWVADRADAGRFRWLIQHVKVSEHEHNQVRLGEFFHYIDWDAHSDSATSDIRALIDAAMAKDPQL